MDTELLMSRRGTSESMFECLQKEISRRGRNALLRRLKSETRAQELVEFAFLALFVLPPLLIGIIWMGRAISVYETLTRAAREGARVALAPACARCGGAAATDGEIEDAIEQHLIAASVDPNLLKPRMPTIVRSSATADTTSNPANYQVPWVTITLNYEVPMRIMSSTWTAFKLKVTSTVTMHQE
jgi:TadE-like protein